MHKRLFKLLFISLISVFGICVSTAQTLNSNVPIDTATSSIFEMSLEDLLNVEVTSVSKKAEKLQNVASALYVLTSDDISRSGATNLVELLRQVPGFWAAQDEYNTASGSMRYSAPENGPIGSVLYLLDGTPLQELMTSNMSFKNFDIPLDEIDRIEVIKGSGGSIYGANSATGVVSIFTKNSDRPDKVNIKVEGATPSYFSSSLRMGGEVSERLSVSGYGKYRYFNGFGLVDQLKGDSLNVPKSDSTGNIKVRNRYTNNYEKQQMFSIGTKLVYDLSTKSKLSFNIHFNTLFKDEYTTKYLPNSLFSNPISNGSYGQRDTALFFHNKNYRLTYNLRFDHEFSDKHSMFVRVSSNQEKEFLKFSGGYGVNNKIYDLEAQDNLQIGKYNNLSFGANFRFVKIHVQEIVDQNYSNFINPDNHQTLKGAFIQDKLSLFDSKLNITGGIKAEQYTLVNDNFYFSPSVKAALSITEKTTVWAGYTKSYTTPGFNQTNIDGTLFKAPSAVFLYSQVEPAVKNGVYQGAFAQAVGAGADSTTAASQANAYINSNDGKAVIQQQTVAQTQLAYPGYYNVGIKNGSKTVPTKFQTLELGFRISEIKNVTLETNFYYSFMSDGLAPSIGIVNSGANSLTTAGQKVDYYLYGNYLKGVSYGNESVVKTKPVKWLTLEGSYTWLETKVEYQKNSDFDISKFTEEQKNRTPRVPLSPKHVFRFKTYIDLPSNFELSASAIYATKTKTDAKYQYDLQRYSPVLGGNGYTVSPNSDRLIVNLRVEKSFLNKKLVAYVFGNDILNTGKVEHTDLLYNVTLHQIKAMYGLGVNYSF